MKKAFTVVELLVVILIIAILASLLFPVFTRSKESAKKADCSQRLHQSAISLQMYIDDQGDYPVILSPKIGESPGGIIYRSSALLLPYLANNKMLMVCPMDKPDGRIQIPIDRAVSRSYAQLWFLWEGSEGRDAWRSLLALDSNPVVFRCNFHEARVRAFLLKEGSEHFYGSLEHGHSQAVRADGSVFFDKNAHYYPLKSNTYPEDYKRTFWSLATSVECPTKICDGREPAEGIREL